MSPVSRAPSGSQAAPAASVVGSIAPSGGLKSATGSGRIICDDRIHFRYTRRRGVRHVSAPASGPAPSAAVSASPSAPGSKARSASGSAAPPPSVAPSKSVAPSTAPSGSKAASGSKAPSSSKAPTASKAPSGSKAPSASKAPTASKAPPAKAATASKAPSVPKSLPPSKSVKSLPPPPCPSVPAPTTLIPASRRIEYKIGTGRPPRLTHITLATKTGPASGSMPVSSLGLASNKSMAGTGTATRVTVTG